MKWIWKTLVFVLILVIVFFGFYTIVNFNPADVKKIEIAQSNNSKVNNIKKELTILSWNIGYAGMGEDMDYFMDGGDRNNPTKDESKDNFARIKRYLNSKKADFYLLQEVDKDSKRSYSINQYKQML